MRTMCMVGFLLAGCVGPVEGGGDGGVTPPDDGGVLRDGGGPADGGEMLADAGDSRTDGALPNDGGPPPTGDAGPPLAGDAGPLPSITGVGWEVAESVVYSGTLVRVTATLSEAGGAPARGGLPATIEIGEGTSTGTFSAVMDLGSGRYAVDFRARDEGTPIRFAARLGGTSVGGSSDPLTVIVPLRHYSAAGAAVTLSAVGRNLSGNTWNPVTGEFLLIRNNDRFLHVLDPDFSHVAAVALSSVPISSDLEDIVYLGGPASAPEYAVIDEAGNIAIGVIPPGVTGGLNMGGWQTVTYAPRPPVGNKGGEGLAFDPATGRFWACTERSPMSVYQFTRPTGSGDASYETGLPVTEPFDAQAALGGAISDISSCLFDPRTGRLLILSDQSSRILDVDLDGSVIAELPVSGAPQFEGVTLFDDGHLLVTSEPNRYREYRYDGPVL